jgi:phage tail-like protein
MPLETSDAIGAYRFMMEIDGVTVAEFREVTGISEEIEPIIHLEANSEGKTVVRKTPGKHNHGDITLKRGRTDSNDLWSWFQKVQQGNMSEARKNGSIVLYDYANEEVSRFNFINAWPSRVSVGSLSAGSSEIVLEECTIVHEGLMPDGMEA